MEASIPNGFRIIHMDSVDSTNDEVRRQAAAGAAEGLVIVAERQLAGRGRRGTVWFSPPGDSLAFSILLRPTEAKSLWPRLALATGLSVAEAIGAGARVKWPNDVWIDGRKVAGILIEAGPDFVIVGVGINVNTTEFPTEVVATSLKLATGDAYSRDDVLRGVLRSFAMWRHQIDDNFQEIIDQVKLRCVLTGHPVSLISGNATRVGLVEGISASGELLFRTNEGLERLIQADEVRLL